ncbi:MAG TPA: hypothetical protein VNX68_12705, partial [Nitrosopumilaceae archaeon]|nr:hypothetical protein [Nitrosopumilaceae archaeon]
MRKLLILLFAVGLFKPVSSQIIYVNTAAAGANNGTSWANAYKQFQNAVTAAGPGAQIWVAAGNYFPGLSGQNGNSFTLKNNVQIYGGFNGTENALGQRNFFLHRSVLSGDLDQSGGPSAADAYHVVSTLNTDSTASLDGFTIMGGNATGTFPNNTGAGILCNPSIFATCNPIIRNCLIESNTTNVNGAGIAILNTGSGGLSCPIITDCKIYN